MNCPLILPVLNTPALTCDVPMLSCILLWSCADRRCALSLRKVLTCDWVPAVCVRGRWCTYLSLWWQRPALSLCWVVRVALCLRPPLRQQEQPFVQRHSRWLLTLRTLSYIPLRKQWLRAITSSFVLSVVRHLLSYLATLALRRPAGLLRTSRLDLSTSMPVSVMCPSRLFERALICRLKLWTPSCDRTCPVCRLQLYVLSVLTWVTVLRNFLFDGLLTVCLHLVTVPSVGPLERK